MNIPIPTEGIIGIVVIVLAIIINMIIAAKKEHAARIKRISDSFRQIKLKCSVEARTKHGGSTNFELALIEKLLSLGATVVLAKDSSAAKDVVQILATVTEIVTEKTSNEHKVLSTTSYEARTTNPSPEISPYYPTLKVEYSSVYEVEIRVISADGNNIITVHNGSYVYGPDKVICDLLEKIIFYLPREEGTPTSEQK